MSEEIPLISLPISTLEKLRCFLCKGFLSCSPVLLLPNGQNICGRCSPLNTDTPIHRLVAFEAVLNNVLFPCVFKKYGCSEMTLFGKTIEHESKCVYKPIACPTNGTCSWEGITSQLLQHFEDGHPDLVKDKLEFQFELNRDGQGFLITTENLFVFIVKYIYKAKEKNLQYDLRCCSDKNGFEISWNTQLINSSDSDCKMSLKSNKCLAYDESFYNTQNAKVLDINKCLENLGDPDSTIVQLKLKFIKPNGADKNNCKVNFDSISNLKCAICLNYLVPPLFDLNGRVICYDCSKTRSRCKPCNDLNFLNLENEAIYPCRWQECSFVGKSNILNNHEMNCEFRMHCCVYNHCTDTFKFCAAGEHLQTHINGYTIYMPNTISFAINRLMQNILTVKGKRIIFIKHGIVDGDDERYCIVRFRQARDDPIVLTGIVVFEHKHCNLKSKGFTIISGKSLCIWHGELPPCFEESEELTATIEFAE